MVNKKHKFPSDKKRKRIIKIQAKTDPKYGKSPDERTVKELINSGLINLDKPSGPTSHQVDSWIKEILNTDKVGHGGTLDPNATGILPIGIGDATKVLQVLLLTGKEYVGIMKLHKDVEKKQILEICNSFIGKVTQLPPVRSAVKRVKRKREIYYFDIIEIKNRDVLFRVGCESGTYVRTLCVDIGRKLKAGAHLAELRRTRVGNLKEEDSFNLQDLKDAYSFWKNDKSEDDIRKIIQPVEKIFSHLPKIVVRDSTADALCHGASLAIPGVAEIDSDIKKGDTAAVVTLKGEGVAIVNSLMTTEEIIKKDKGVCANLERVLMKKGTYPSIWKKS
jgi:H/ACA ribonucleoprotein complex subunit 4